MSIKKGLEKKLSAFIIFDVIAITYFSIVGKQDIEYLKLITSFASAPLIYFFTTLLPADLKASISLFKIKHALPGHRAFSIYMHKDSRIDVDKLGKTLGELPINPEKQNSKWYQIYRKLHTEPAILDINKRFIFCRDLATLSLILTIAVPVVTYLNNASIKFVFISGAVFLIQYALSIIATRQAANRLVCTVLAMESVS